MKSVTYTKLDKKLYTEWLDLWNTSSFSNYTNSPQWFSAVLEGFHYRDYIIVGIYEKNTLKAIAGLIKVKKYGLDIYTLPPNDHICGLPFLIDVAEKKQMQLLHDQLLRLGVVYLDNIPKKFVEKIQNISTHAHEHTFSLNYYIPLQGNGQTVTLANRKELLRRVKKIASEITFASYPGSDRRGLQEVFAIDSVSRKQKRGYNVFASSQMRKFYSILAKTFGKNMRCNILYYKNEPIAYEIGFMIKNTYFGNQLGFAEAYRHLSPGKAISVELADYLFAQGVTVLDFGSGDSHLKRLITKEKRQLYVVVLSKKSIAKLYIHSVSSFRNTLFTMIEKNKQLYIFYRMIKNVRKK